VKRNKVSDEDPRTKDQILKGGMTGGDRMSEIHHNYGYIYATDLLPFINKNNISIAEIGILTGVGLSIWCEIFLKCNIYGLDIDLTIFEDNKTNFEHFSKF
jgi:hypothetical protein